MRVHICFLVLLGIIFILPMLGRQVGVDLNLFRWAVGISLQWLTPILLADGPYGGRLWELRTMRLVRRPAQRSVSRRKPQVSAVLAMGDGGIRPDPVSS